MSTAEQTPDGAVKKRKIQWAEDPKIGLAEALYLPAIAGGVATALKHVFFQEENNGSISGSKP